MTRPAFHYAAAANWLSDPNGLVFHEGIWHLFYQYNPHGDLWGHMAWGHATSADLVDWTEQPPALLEDEAHLIFSGSAVVDRTDSAGFGAGSLVAIYTGADRDPERLQVQCLAASTDRGITWTKYSGNPVLDIGRHDFRDPNVIWHEATQRWIMITVVATENRALFFASRDLKTWEQLDALCDVPAPGKVWECPMLIELPVEGNDARRWLFKVDILEGGPGSGAIGIIGEFDGQRFIPDRDDDGAIAWQVLDHGRDFYAAIAWHDPRDEAGRPAWIGWLGNHGYQRDLPPRGWRGAMSVPRRMSLVITESGYRLRQVIEPALADRFRPLEPNGALEGGTRIDVTVSLGAEQTLVVSGRDGPAVTLRFRDGRVRIERAAEICDLFDAISEGPMPPGNVTLWFDRVSLELHDADGLNWHSVQHCLSEGPYTLETNPALSPRIAVYAG